MNNKFLSIAASTAIVASALVFSGCGDSDSSSTPAATTTTTTAAGTLTGTAVKGPWSNVTYTVTTNGTLANSTGTMTGGAFSFGTTSDNVTIDLGMAKWKIVNPAANSAFSFLNVAGEGGKLLRTNGTEYSSTDYTNVIDNLLLATLTFENDTSALESVTTPYNAGTLISNFAKLAATGLDLTQASATFQTSLATNLTAANLTSVNKTSVATAATSMVAYKTAIRASYGAKLASTYASLNSLNNTMLNNTFIILTHANGSKCAIDLTGFADPAGSANSNLTASGLTSLAAGRGNASGSVIKFGSTNMTNLSADYAVFTSSLSGLRSGSTATMRYVDSAGTMKEYTVNAIRVNLTNILNGNAGYANISKAFNITLTDSYGNPKMNISTPGLSTGSTPYTNATVNKYVAANNTWIGINSTDTAGTYNNTLTLVGEAGMPGLNTTLEVINATSGVTGVNSFMNLTFDLDPAGYQNGGNSTFANGGVVATIVNTIDSALLALGKFWLSLFNRIG